MLHELKTDHEVFKAVSDGQRTFEIRFDDRHYQVGDILTLRETRYTGDEMNHKGAPLEYTGATISFSVSHMLRGPIHGLKEGWVIMSLRSDQRCTHGHNLREREYV